MTETPAEALARLRSKEPRWTPDRKAPHLSVTGESRASFEARHAAWEAAVERENARLRSGE